MRHARLILLTLMAAVVGGSSPPATKPSEPAAEAAADLRAAPEFAALAHMIERHASFSEAERKKYSAYVVPQSPLGDAVVRAFAGRTPPVSNTVKVDTASGDARSAADNRPVKCWNVKLRERHGDGAVVGVSWYSGLLAAGGYRVELARRDGKWVVVRARMEWVS